MENRHFNTRTRSSLELRVGQWQRNSEARRPNNEGPQRRSHTHKTALHRENVVLVGTGMAVGCIGNRREGGEIVKQARADRASCRQSTQRAFLQAAARVE